MPQAPLRPCRAPGCAVVGPCAEHELVRGRQVRERRPLWDGWYRIARWRHAVWGLRARVLARSPLCVMCRGEGRVVAASQVDHIVPHQGDPELFWKVDNLQALCDRHHAEKTARGL
jgi:5-methylcytosine-specific restriction protein A